MFKKRTINIEKYTELIAQKDVCDVKENGSKHTLIPTVYIENRNESIKKNNNIKLS